MQMPDDFPTIVADDRRLKQVFNLIGNYKYFGEILIAGQFDEYNIQFT